MFKQLTCAVLAAAALASAPVYAIDDGTREADVRSANSSVTYSGIGLVQAKSDFDNLKPAVNLDAVIGFRIPTIDIFAIELNISTTVIPGSRSEPPACATNGGLFGGGTATCPGKFTSSQDDLQMSNVGVFAVVRSPGKLYGMAKIGYRYLNTNVPEITDKSGSAFGVGGGYRWGKSLSGAELFYTHYSSEMRYLGFNISYGFGGHD